MSPFVVAWGISAIAAINDLRAFKAVASPIVLTWLVLCGVSAAAMLVVAYGRTAGRSVPGYFRATLAIGAASGLFAVPQVWQVIQKVDVAPTSLDRITPLDLSGRFVHDVDLSHRDLRRANLAGAVLVNVSFNAANLSEANLRGARFEDVDFASANLCGADVRGADLGQARNLDSVESWAYTFYDKGTVVPADLTLLTFTGAIPDTGRGVLYMCRPNETNRISPS